MMQKDGVEGFLPGVWLAAEGNDARGLGDDCCHTPAAGLGRMSSLHQTCSVSHSARHSTPLPARCLCEMSAYLLIAGMASVATTFSFFDRLVTLVR